jgi:outer membrane protein assembly factor BamB
MSIRSSTLTAFLVTSIPVQQLTAANWPEWRGPNQTGVSTESNLPVRFGTAENVRWHVHLPAPGNSSPIVWGNRVFVTQFVPAENRRTLICLDRSNGKVLWQSGIVYTEAEQTQENNPYCAGTPATDGKLVVVCFGSPGVYAYDFDGKEVWHRDLGKISHMFGNAVCPIIHREQCFLNFGPDANARLIALDLSTGKTVWEAVPPKPDPSETPSMQGPRPGDPNRPPPGGPPGPRGDGGAREGAAGGPADAPPLGRPTGPGGPPPGSADIAGGPGGPGGGFRPPPGGRGGRPGGASWSTPVVVTVAGHDELVVNFPNRLVAYDPPTGKQLWVSKGVGGSIYTTPAVGNGIIVGNSGGPGGGSAIALKAGGSGDVTESQKVWHLDRVKSAIGSGVIGEGHLFTISQDGIASCLDLQDGKIVWEERLKGSTSRNSSWSSILLANGKLYIPNQSGDVFVVRASAEFQILATNAVGEPTNASLAASDGELFLRTNQGLWCFASSAP